MPILVYWRRDIYAKDIELGFKFHLNQDILHFQNAEIGEEVFAFTQNAARKYVMAAQFFVAAKGKNGPDDPYGQYRLWMDRQCSRMFDTETGQSCDALVRSLVKARGSILGRAFQGPAAVRPISLAAALEIRRHLREADELRVLATQTRLDHEPTR